MAPNAQRPTYVEEGRVALSVRLPREMHTRMRKLAIDRDCRVNLLGEPFLRAPPTSATPVTLWLEPTFSDQFREALERRCLTATNVVVTALLHHFGEDHPTHDRLALQTAA